MGPSALTALIERFDGDAPPAVLSRSGASWGPPTGDFLHDVRGLAAAFLGYGLNPDSRVAVLGREERGTLCGGLAVIAAGATLVPLDPAIADDGLRRALASTGTVYAIASDERQLARILALRPELPALELVLLISASPSERKPAALLVPAAIEVGSVALAADPDLLRRAVAETEDGTACLLADGRGETRPVGRKALLALSDALGKSLGIKAGATVLVGLPVSGLARLGASLAVLSRGASLQLPDPAQRPDAGLDQRPADAVLLDVAGLGRLHRAWIEDIAAKSWMGRAATRWALRQARDPEQRGFKRRLAEQVALRGLHKKLGGRATTLNVMTTSRGGASAEVDGFFAAVGLKIRYLSPETGSVLAR